MMLNKPHIIEEEILYQQKKAAEELNAPNPFVQLQQEWADDIAADEEKKAEIIEAVKKQQKLSPGALKKLKEWRPL